MNVLVILPHTFFEVVCSTALLRCVHQQVNGAQLHVIVPEAFAFALEGNPHITQLVSTSELHIVVSPNKYEIVIDVAGLYENMQWASAVGIRYLTFPKQSFFSNFFTIFGQKVIQHIALEMVAIAKPLVVRYDEAGLDYFIAQKYKVPQQDIPVSHSAGFVALALGNELLLHPDVLRHFCSSLPFPVMLIGPRSMFATAQALAQPDNVKVYNACGKFSEGETADLLNRSRVVVSADAGWMQVAAALGKPVVAWTQGKSTSVHLPPLYANHFIKEKGVPFALLRCGKAALAPSTKSAPHPEREAAGAQLVHLVQAFLFKK